MKMIQRTLALAIAASVGLASVYAAELTNDWWTVNFTDGYINGGLITNSAAQANGVWTSTGEDASIMTNDTVASYTSNMGKINTEGGTLVWTPNPAKQPADMTKVLVDTKVYMVGSEDAPEGSTGTVQTEVFLTNSIAGETTTSYLCAHVGEGEGTKWVQLSGVAVFDQSWIDLRIEIDYAPTPPQISFYVGSIQLTDGTSGHDGWFDVMPAGAGQSTVTDVTFMGTGYFDNFVGRGIAIQTFADGGKSTDGGEATGAADSIVEGENTVVATFTTGTQYIKMTGPDGFVRTARVSGGEATFSTVDLPAGTYSIVAYYGAAPTVIPTGYKPVAVATGENKAAEVVAENIKLNVAPTSGLYYTLFAGETVAGVKAASASVLATPADEDAGFLQITMPLPVTANEVKIIKIVASDDPYTIGEAAE